MANVQIHAISQIPGLNPDSVSIAKAEEKTFRRLKSHESDTPYTQLAKKGGRPNLLFHDEFSASAKADLRNAQTYKIQRPFYFQHEEHVKTAKSCGGYDCKKNEVEFGAIFFPDGNGARKERPDLVPVEKRTVYVVNQPRSRRSRIFN